MATLPQSPPPTPYARYLNVYAKAMGNCLDSKDLWHDTDAHLIAVACAMLDAKVRVCAPRSRSDLQEAIDRLL